MKLLQERGDKLAIGLSLICALHCLVLPLVVALLPSVVALALSDESFHKWVLLIVFPSSVFSLTLGCKMHKRYRILLIGLIGLIVLISPVMLGPEVVGEVGGKRLTLFGATIVAAAHLWNFRLCSQSCHS